MATNDRQATTGDGIDRRTLLNGAAVVGGATLAGALIPGTAQAAPLPGSGLLVRFSLSTGGVEIASFSELSGLVTEVEPNQYLARGEPINLRRTKPPTAVLSRGVTDGTELWAWHAQVLAGDLTAPKNCTLVGFGEAGDALVRYLLERAWPAKLELAAANTGSPAVETVTLVMDRAQRVSP